MKIEKTIEVSDTGSSTVPLVSKEDLVSNPPLPTLIDTHKEVAKESKNREKYIQKIKKYVTEPYDNINNPVPFIPSRA